jgi:hypothetical protein
MSECKGKSAVCEGVCGCVMVSKLSADVVIFIETLE